MAKKVRRVKRSKPKVTSAVTPSAEPVVRARPASEKTLARRRKKHQRKVEPVDFKEEYAYVIRDLRRILYLALAMFALLIALNIGFQFVG